MYDWLLFITVGLLGFISMYVVVNMFRACCGDEAAKKRLKSAGEILSTITKPTYANMQSQTKEMRSTDQADICARVQLLQPSQIALQAANYV